MIEPTLSMRLSEESVYLERSVMRDLIRLTARPDVLSLAGGLPANELLPADDLRDCMETVLRRDGGVALQYGPPVLALREWIAAYMCERGVTCSAEQVYITNGNQQGLTILSRLFLDPGKTAVTEAITFTGIQQVTKGRGANVLTVPTDLKSGVDVDALEAAFEQHPSLAVLIPDFHNPLGVTMTQDKRQRVAQLAARYRVPVVEDDPYSALRFDGEALPPIKAYDNIGTVFYLGSFSKMLAPALRLGWMIVPEALNEKITVMREAIDLESSALIQRTAAEYLSRGLLDAHLQRLNAVNKERAGALLAALDEYLGDIATWTQPEGGLFVWVTLPETVDTWQLFDAALARDVAFIPGSAFAVDSGYHNTMRLNFSKLPPHDLREGVQRLASVIRESL